MKLKTSAGPRRLREEEVVDAAEVRTARGVETAEPAYPSGVAARVPSSRTVARPGGVVVVAELRAFMTLW
jgi:hypothetical protein